MLAATLTTAVVFFPVTFLYGVSRFLFSALCRWPSCFSLFASYAVAMTVVPAVLRAIHQGAPAARHAVHRGAYNGGAYYPSANFWRAFNLLVQRPFRILPRVLRSPMRRSVLRRPLGVAVSILGILFVAVSTLFPGLGLVFFPGTDPGQFVINLKAPTGTRLELTQPVQS